MVREIDKAPQAITREDLRDYFAALVKAGQASSTVRQKLCAAKLFFKKVLGRDEPFFVDARAPVRKKLPEVISVKEVRRLIEALTSPVYQAMAIVAYSCALRLSETLGLQAAWIKGDDGLLHVHDGKGGIDRMVPLPQSALARLRRFWQDERPSSESKYVFVSGWHLDADQPVCAKTYRTALHMAAEAASIRIRVTPHTLRHCYASHLLQHGVPLPCIQKWLGHANIQTTQVYAQITEVTVADARKILEGLMDDL